MGEKWGKMGKKWVKKIITGVEKRVLMHASARLASVTTPQTTSHAAACIYRAGGKKAGEVRTVESTTCLLGELDAKNASSFAFIDSVGEAFCNHRPALL